MNEPIHPKICACPCACSQACDRLPGPLACEIEMRFHTPRNVPGRSMKIRPLIMNTDTICWLLRSRLTRSCGPRFRTSLSDMCDSVHVQHCHSALMMPMADTHLPYSVSSGSPYALSRDYVASACAVANCRLPSRRIRFVLSIQKGTMDLQTMLLQL